MQSIHALVWYKNFMATYVETRIGCVQANVASQEIPGYVYCRLGAFSVEAELVFS